MCCECGLNTEQIRKKLFKLRAQTTSLKRQGLPFVTELAGFWKLATQYGLIEPANSYLPISIRKIRTLWEANHIKPVFEGGGSCGLDNVQSMCILCHRKMTATQATRRSKRS